MKTPSRNILDAVRNSRCGDIEAHEFHSENERFLIIVVPLPETDAFDRPWKSIFIDWIRKGVTIEKAAHLAGVSRRYVYLCREHDERFREAWSAARQ